MGVEPGGVGIGGGDIKHATDDLRMMQALPLELKIKMTRDRVRSWVSEYGQSGCYISYSGGKDSTVLLHIVKEDYPDIPAVFVNTGLEYPEVRRLALSNADKVLKPKMGFKKVIEKYGYPVVSKEQAHSIRQFRTTKSEKLARKRLYGDDNGKMAVIAQKWRPLIYAPFCVSEQCCDVMKKRPAHAYYAETGRHQITGEMASESLLRKQKWLKNGCNAYDLKIPKSTPLAFWTDQDILQYIVNRNLTIPSVYGDIVTVDADDCEYANTLFGGDKLKTTGVSRTGCMYCMFGVHLEPEPNRFQQMKITHPAQYACAMRLGIGYILDYIGVPH